MAHVRPQRLIQIGLASLIACFAFRFLVAQPEAGDFFGGLAVALMVGGLVLSRRSVSPRI